MWKQAAGITLLLGASMLAPAAQAETAAPAKAETAAAKPVAPAPKSFTTHHNIAAGKLRLDYQAVAEEMDLNDHDGKPEARIFSTGYFLAGSGAAAGRPIAFLFNGGPGSSSVWLHLGAFGPERVDIAGDPVNPGAPPYRLVPNAQTLLVYSDLVFVDPVGTGYSRALGDKKDKDFWGVDEDADSMARFVRDYLTKHKRWASPKYFIGESYGTIRASLLLRELQLGGLSNVAINGVVLLSAAMDVRPFLSGFPGNDLAYVTCLPTYAATAFFHHALDPQPADLQAFLRDARQFAATEYLTALFAGDPIPADRQQALAEKMHHFTGLSVDYLLRARLRVDDARFRKELLRSRGQTIAAHDTRFLGRDADDAGENVDIDPFIGAIGAPFVSTMNDYLTGELGTDFERPYAIFSAEANRSWKRRGGEAWFDGYLYTLPYLAQAAAINSGFRVFVACGYHDLTTTFFGAEHQIQESGIDPKRVTLREYNGGHMMYLDPESRTQLAADVGAFIQNR